MNTKALFGAFAILLVISLIAGCKPQFEANVTVSPDPSVDINPITGEPYHDIESKRNQTTNITEFDELVRRASAIQSYKYDLTDTELGIEGQAFYSLGRFVKTRLPYTDKTSSGQTFDEVFMERLTKQAFTHCSKYACEDPIDKEIERTDYADYYINDPYEYLTRSTRPEFVKEEMIGNDYTKVFTVMFEGKEARIWLQEYYGYPLKIIVRNADDSKRTITFDNMMIDATRRGEIDLPFNFTISGEEGQWYFWEHYLGEWPVAGSDLTIPMPGTPALGV